MNHRELVLAALSHQETSRIPKGELMIDGGFVRKALPQPTGDPFEDLRAVMDLLDMDMVVVDAHPLCPGGDGPRDSLEALKRWVQETDYFPCVMVGGPFYRTMMETGMESFLEDLVYRPARIRERAREITTRQIAKGLEYLEAGASGVIIGDDIAYNEGTYISPHALREHFFPFLSEEVGAFKEKGAAVLFHSDGNYRSELDDIVSTGVDGIQCLQESCGMRGPDLKEAYGRRITIMGNLEAERQLEGLTPGEIKRRVRDLLADCAGGGGYIFGTCSGLSEHTSLEHVLASYDAVREYERG